MVISALGENPEFWDQVLTNSYSCWVWIKTDWKRSKIFKICSGRNGLPNLYKGLISFWLELPFSLWLWSSKTLEHVLNFKHIRTAVDFSETTQICKVKYWLDPALTEINGEACIDFSDVGSGPMCLSTLLDQAQCAQHLAGLTQWHVFENPLCLFPIASQNLAPCLCISIWGTIPVCIHSALYSPQLWFVF